ncbi:MAG: hypothetical protein B6I24_11140 [Bacteroidetes bacterium 4572_128]|nr:MAG: hypothetical protein B6I24_11140 [Bacteroidetes bacterium 4572_128]
MQLVTPDIGLLFWMFLSFLTVFFILKAFAWKPILKSLKERETSIEKSLLLAKRDILLKEAREVKNKIIYEAQKIAHEEADRIINQAMLEIENEKKSAILDMKKQISIFSIEIAEKILKEKLKTEKKQIGLINSLLKDINLN